MRSSAPGSDVRTLAIDASRRFEEFRIEHIVIVDENKKVAAGLGDPSQPCAGKAGFIFSYASNARVPCKIDPCEERLLASTVDQDEFPLG